MKKGYTFKITKIEGVGDIDEGMVIKVGNTTYSVDKINRSWDMECRNIKTGNTTHMAGADLIGGEVIYDDDKTADKTAEEPTESVEPVSENKAEDNTETTETAENGLVSEAES